MINGVDVNDNLFGSAQHRLHRGRGRADERADVGHLGRVRPVQRRRDQPDHEERRQHVLRQLPQQLRRTMRGRSRRPARRPTATRPARQAESQLRRRRSADRSCATGCGSSPRAAWQDTSHTETLPQTNLPFEHDHQDTPLRGQGHGNDGQPHAPGELHQGYDRTRCGCRSPSRSIRMLPSTRAFRTGSSSPATTACCRIASRHFQVSQKKEGFEMSGRHHHRHPRLSVLHARVADGAWRPALQRQLLRRYRSGRPRQLPDHRQPLVLRDHAAGGTHDIKGGFEHFKSNQTGGNSQSASGYVFDTDYVPGAARPY